MAFIAVVRIPHILRQSTECFAAPVASKTSNSRTYATSSFFRSKPLQLMTQHLKGIVATIPSNPKRQFELVLALVTIASNLIRHLEINGPKSIEVTLTSPPGKYLNPERRTRRKNRALSPPSSSSQGSRSSTSCSRAAYSSPAGSASRLPADTEGRPDRPRKLHE
jgi:hypothetical protein